MSFISYEYVIFLTITILMYYLFPKKYRYLILLFGSLIFYYLCSNIYIIFLLLSVISVYILSVLFNKNKFKKLLLIIGILFNFTILITLKYLGVFNTSYIIPIGISYYILMSVSYLVDVYRGKIKCDKNIFRVSLYLTFFPQMISGPISSYSDTADNLYKGNKFDIDNLLKGTFRIFIGIFKILVISRRCEIFVNSLFSSNVHGYLIFIGGLIYTLEIYADFSGCMDIVCGSANMFGIDLPENFKRPFFSKNIQEFWKRWHITLGEWIKNYIFYPISFSKINIKFTNFCNKHLNKNISSLLIIIFPLLFVWLFMGLWHGISIKYVIYGMYYYILIIIGILLKKIKSKLKINEKNVFFKIYEILRTSILVVFGMMLFRSSTFGSFINNICHMFLKTNMNIYAFGLKKFDFIIFIIYVVLLIAIGIYKEKHGNSIYSRMATKNVLVQYGVWALLMLSIIILGIYGTGYDASSFIYGAF